MKSIPTIQKYMTMVPRTIGIDQPIARAQEVMSELQIRHLPVLDGGRLVGIVSDRDVNLLLGFRDADPEKMTVQDACTEDPYFTTPEAPLDEVAALMAEKKYGCALVVDHGKLVGVFTQIDALSALSDLLKTRLKH